MSIVYKTRRIPKIGDVVDVYLNGQKAGTICRQVGGWQYQIGKFKGEIFPSLEAVKRSLQ